nr:hypothetical protein [Betaproteobacteria bacterium]
MLKEQSNQIGNNQQSDKAVNGRLMIAGCVRVEQPSIKPVPHRHSTPVRRSLMRVLRHRFACLLLAHNLTSATLSA